VLELLYAARSDARRSCSARDCPAKAAQSRIDAQWAILLLGRLRRAGGCAASPWPQQRRRCAVTQPRASAEGLWRVSHCNLSVI